MAKLGFLGLGLMGYPMALNLARAGHELAVWSNTASKAKQLASEENAAACDTPAQVAERADYVFACVGNTEMSVQVLTGENGVIDGAKPGTVVADASTISPPCIATRDLTSAKPRPTPPFLSLAPGNR